MVRKPLTHEEFLEKFYKKNDNAENIEILGTYVNSKTKIKCKCRLDGYEWEVIPNNLLNNHGCPKCSGKMQKTHEEFMKDFIKKNKNAENIEILGEYINVYTKIKCKCRLDGYEWEARPSDLLSGYSCPKCGGTGKLTHEEFLEKFYKKNDNAENIEILGKYKGSLNKIKVRCKIDNHIWETKPSVLLNNHGCPKCSGKVTRTHEEFVQEMEEINSNIEILGEYVDTQTKIKVRCKIDNHIWEITPNSLLNNHGCPKCNASKGERRISKYLNNRNIEYKEQYRFNDCKFKIQLPFDFYISSLNTIIEYDGRQHFEIIDYFGGLDVFIDTKIRDTVKNIYCKENNIKLIRIPYWDFDRIEEILDKEL